MNIAFLTGRFIFSAYWLAAGFNHFKNIDYMTEYSRTKGVPAPKLAVAGSGVLLLVGGLSFLLGICPVIGIWLVIVFLLGASFVIHRYWQIEDPKMRQMEMINFSKNMALVGALLMMLLLPRPWPMSVRLR
jgi:putative oxidoreductase